jgi:two-component system nitrate/nitrite response regulator NarL
MIEPSFAGATPHRRRNHALHPRADEVDRSPSAARVAIVDDHPLMCYALEDNFRGDDFDVVAVCHTAEAAIEVAARHLPDLMVVDLSIPGNGLSALQTISCRYPAIKLLVLSVHKDPAHVNAPFRAGASGYLPKGVSTADLLATARAVLRSECYVPPTMAAGLLSARRSDLARLAEAVHPEQPDLTVRLTDREEQILAGIARGQTNREIAQALGLAEKTVKNYITNVLRKLHVRTRIEAALVAASRQG